MKNLRIVNNLAFIATFAAVATSFAETVVNCNVRLVDNSSVKGVFANEKIVGDAIFQPKLAIGSELIKELVFKDTNGVASVELRNGDKLTLEMATEKFTVNSILGELSIPRKNVKSMSLSVQRDPASAAADDGLVYWCTMDSEADVERPAVGPGGRIENGVFVPGKFGNALHVPPYSIAAIVPFPAGTLGSAGCIEFWAKIENQNHYFTDKGDPHFLEIDFADGVGMSGFHLEYNANNGMGRSGLCGGCPVAWCTTHPGFCAQMPYESVLRPGAVDKWHHYALVWDERGVGVDGELVYCRLMIDGKVVSKINMNGSFVDVKSAFGKISAWPCTLKIPVKHKDVMSHSKSAFLIDELKIWNYAKTTFDDLATE